MNMSGSGSALIQSVDIEFHWLFGFAQTLSGAPQDQADICLQNTRPQNPLRYARHVKQLEKIVPFQAETGDMDNFEVYKQQMGLRDIHTTWPNAQTINSIDMGM